MKNYVSNAQGINKSSCIWTEKPTTFDFLIPDHDENPELRVKFQPITG